MNGIGSLFAAVKPVSDPDMVPSLSDKQKKEALLAETSPQLKLSSEDCRWRKFETLTLNPNQTTNPRRRERFELFDNSEFEKI